MSKKHTRFVVLVGSTDNNLEIYHEMSGSEDTGYSVVGYFDGQANPAFPVECPYLGQPAQVQEYLEKHDYVHYLFCCLPSKDREVIVSLIDYCENHWYISSVCPMCAIISTTVCRSTSWGTSLTWAFAPIP